MTSYNITLSSIASWMNEGNTLSKILVRYLLKKLKLDFLGLNLGAF